MDDFKVFLGRTDSRPPGKVGLTGKDCPRHLGMTEFFLLRGPHSSKLSPIVVRRGGVFYICKKENLHQIIHPALKGGQRMFCIVSYMNGCLMLIHQRLKEQYQQRWAGPQHVPLCAFPQLAQQGKLLRMCALIRFQLTAELRLRTKK